MACLFYNRITFILILSGILLAVQPRVDAAEAGSLQIRMDQNVMYCSARMHVAEHTLASVMKDGIAVATEWHIHVGKVRNYWLNESIADITVLRHAKPDLLTRSWLLTDTSSGISRRVYRIEDAIDFLSGLEHFPVLDTSLLLPKRQYRISVSVEIHNDGIDNAWWASFWHAAAASMQQDFSLP